MQFTPASALATLPALVPKWEFLLFTWLRNRLKSRVQADLPDTKVVEILDVPGRLVLARRQWGECAAGGPFDSIDVLFVPKQGKAVELIIGVEGDLWPQK